MKVLLFIMEALFTLCFFAIVISLVAIVITTVPAIAGNERALFVLVRCVILTGISVVIMGVLILLNPAKGKAAKD